MLFLALALLVPSTSAIPMPIHLPPWLSSLIPHQEDSSFSASVKCYSLPYGGIGFLSHLLTYWTVIMLLIGKSPWLPGKELKHWILDFILGLGSLGITIILSVLAIIRCHSEWWFILIATWKMLLSISLSVIAIHRAITVSRNKADNSSPAWWLILYEAGVVIGLTGLIALLIENWLERTRAMEVICGVFGGIAMLCVVIAIVLWNLAEVSGKGGSKLKNFVLSCFSSIGGGFLALLAVTGFLTALWSDWILAAMEVKDGGSWAGTPSSDIAWLYWSYFVAKRLTFFSL